MTDAKMESIAKLAKTELIGLVPFLLISSDDNLCSNVHIRGSFDAKETWKNGILENSRYFRLFIRPPGRYYNEGDKVSVELLSSGDRLKFRKYTSTPDKVIAKIKEFLVGK